jgi:hypothetical protein
MEEGRKEGDASICACLTCFVSALLLFLPSALSSGFDNLRPKGSHCAASVYS